MMRKSICCHQQAAIDNSALQISAKRSSPSSSQDTCGLSSGHPVILDLSPPCFARSYVPWCRSQTPEILVAILGRIGGWATRCLGVNNKSTLALAKEMCANTEKINLFVTFRHWNLELLRQTNFESCCVSIAPRSL